MIFLITILPHFIRKTEIHATVSMADTADALGKTDYNKANANQLLFTTSDTTATKAMIELAKDNGEGFMKFVGEVNPHPSTPWAAEDTITAEVTLIIDPVLGAE